METATLKAFATSARTELIREVTARITAVLSHGSPERVESPTTVASLERAVAAGGSGDKGKAHVADKVAYTWFNRIIALRFMDANGYTGIGVVSPAADQVGQPEVLAAAKRGQIDKEVVSDDRNLATIVGLLNGTRQPRLGADAQAEAYSLLLAVYCQFWNKAMPFMFERQGDFTELLIPANLLAGDSVLNRSVDVLSQDVCKDVEVIGWLYQFYISERKDEVFAGFKKNKKAGADELPAATQLFTPHWIVRYVVENSVGRLWMLNRPASGLVHKMDYYIAPVDQETEFLKIARPEELKVIDPACGSGHMLTYAFDLLWAIYEEEGYAPSEIPGLILANNLYGAEIDPRAGALAAFALTMKAAGMRKLFLKTPVAPNICVIEPISFTPDELNLLTTKDGDRDDEEAFWNQFRDADTLGSLIQPNADATARAAGVLERLKDQEATFYYDTLVRARKAVEQADLLSRKYSVVTANPPYMGSKNMDARLATYAMQDFPSSKSDLFAMFIERCLDLLPVGGYSGLMTPFVWMFIASYEALRKRLIRDDAIITLVQLEYSGFDGATVPVCAYVLRRGQSDHIGAFVRLADFVGPAVQGPKAYEVIQADRMRRAGRPSGGMDRHLYRIATSEFSKVPGTPIAYWLSDAMRAAFAKGRPLREGAEPRKGMDTGENARFLRGWWEVSRSKTSLTEFRSGYWVPYNKGGGFRRWYGYREFLVDWRSGGSEMRTRSGAKYFGREGWTWGTVTSGGFSIRYTPAGAAFDNGGCTLFSQNDLSVAALILNSTTADSILAAISPTLNFQPINVGAVPIMVSDALSSVADSAVKELVSCSRADWDSFETSWDFTEAPWLVNTTSSDRGSETRLAMRADECSARWRKITEEQRLREASNNRMVAEAYGLEGEVALDVEKQRVSLTRNVEFRYGAGKTAEEYSLYERADAAAEFISYAIGCIFGRYSVDLPGLILADQGATLQDYLAQVPSPSFMPDNDNVIPIVDGDWFEDDIVARFRQFLRVAFGDKHLEENLRFVTESLGVKNLREYFITKAGRSKFYDDHVQKYKKRPIYWLFSSPKGSFNALVYMHRYTPSTASTVLTYLREYVTKLESSLQQAERAGNAKEADRLRKILVELNEYEHDTLYPKASENVVIDLDDGVKANYPKLGGALRKIAGLESSGD
ncbi:BREX-1 system adenine-specific DNA-methyltransferase PglX [Mycolicibacterium sp. 050232]|uniref:BREX-1 system adenine-specific DNA-methyltransferase PglX n=1 Tax=Mycolicibacterium sp. 050232 TaxID=3113982 RepID=UPI002E2C5985|nr:BREX-1 system adenine-specific DNA-methyltransferase PglX [Mycolicibacterium sp. 050232]MED5811517.1 BREX-1 system adenine-specific DNA-methyltransferase PglX [Mycolicibacterium sp. 050232]